MHNNYIKVIANRSIESIFFFNDNKPTERDRALADARGVAGRLNRAHVVVFRQVSTIEYRDVKTTMVCWNGHRYDPDYGQGMTCLRCCAQKT